MIPQIVADGRLCEPVLDTPPTALLDSRTFLVEQTHALGVPYADIVHAFESPTLPG